VSIGGHSEGYIKFGAKMRAKNKERNIESLEYAAYAEHPLGYPGVGPELSLVTVNDGFVDDNLLDAGYLLEYMPSPGMLKEFYEFYPQHFVIDRADTKVQSFGEDYKAKERIYAAYGMIRQDFNRLMVLTGLRYEQTNIDYTGVKVVLDGSRFDTILPLTDQRTHKFWLPQVQFKYTLDPTVNLRAALTYTYARPNFEDVLPYREEDRDEVKYGNPDLQYPTSINADLLAEKYLKKSLFSGGLFYKHIDNFIFYFKRFAHEGDPEDFGLVEITKAINGDNAYVLGAELQAQTKFSFLKGFFSDFGIYANYTFTHSEALIGKRYPANSNDDIVIFDDDDLEIFYSTDEQEKITLPGQAKHTANFALFYDTPKFFVRLTANYHDAFLYQLGADADLDEYYDEEFRLDLTANYDLTPYLNVFTDFINLTNTPLRYYLGTPDRIKQQEFYSWWCRFGVKLNF
jgi:TonB-dependent receptor